MVDDGDSMEEGMKRKTPRNRTEARRFAIQYAVAWAIAMSVINAVYDPNGYGITPRSVFISIVAFAFGGVMLGAGMYWWQLRKIQHDDVTGSPPVPERSDSAPRNSH